MRKTKENESIIGFIILLVMLVGGVVAQHAYHNTQQTELDQVNTDQVPAFMKTYDKLTEAKTN